MKISHEEIQKIALLSRLHIPDEKLAETEKALSDILTYVEQLEELDLTDVQPMAHAVPLYNVYREDKVVPSLDHELALSNAPEEDNGYFKVPRVVQE
ncbi:MAG: Asp-tRNA(Asn)/Glu-tRNA(Gln) amidotransferase subunit GatC [Veillonellaceae bacterium]|nr:Asp-tRNA(Asn)/Glu-tRNA(Gln) amidotransferase subunit GatC [Veillonellaceae bacterium]